MSQKLGPLLSNPPATPIVMLVDDQPAMLRVFDRYIRNAGWRSVTCSGIDEVIDRLDSGLSPSVVITDMVLGDSNTGVAVADAVQSRRPSTPVIFMSGYGNVSPRDGDFVLSKDCRPEHFAEFVARVMKRTRGLRREA